MLLQRLRSADPTVEGAIAYNLVDLAMVAPQPVFDDIIRAFSYINKSLDDDDTRSSNNMVELFSMLWDCCWLLTSIQRFSLLKHV